MVDVYESEEIPPWLDEGAKQLLNEGRGGWRHFDLSNRMAFQAGNNVVVPPWVGDRSLITSSLLITSTGLEATADGPVLTVEDCSLSQLEEAATGLMNGPIPDAFDIARRLEDASPEKWDWVLDEDLGAEAMATRLLDIEGAWRMIDLLAHASEIR